jgi:hypothetical protein
MRQNILDLLQQKPFQPFRLYMTGGTVYEVRQPEYGEVQETVMVIRRPDPADPTGQAWLCTLALLHVTRIEVLVGDEPMIVPVRANAR